MHPNSIGDFSSFVAKREGSPYNGSNGRVAELVYAYVSEAYGATLESSSLSAPTMIGIFDSGSGGLSVLQALRTKAPKADIVYFGDIGNSPYGPKSQEELAALVKAGMHKLAERGATEIIAACNSIAFSVLAGAAGHDRLIEMTRPTARMMREHAGKRVLLLATQATVESGIYREALWSIVDLDELPVPRLASSIEDEKTNEEIAEVVRTAFETRKGKTYDHILLGCTHYPLVRDILEREAVLAFPGATLIDPADAVADEAVRRFACEGTGSVQFLISRDSHAFRNRVSPIFLETACSLTLI
jgi:glutamate racemase